MKFPRTTRILKGQFDAVPYLCVLFPLAFFLVFKDMLVLPPGTVLVMPGGMGQPALDPSRPTVSVAITQAGRLFFENQHISVESLESRLRELPDELGEPPVLVLYADQTLPIETVVQIAEMARQAGVAQTLIGGSSHLPTPSP